jgi:hypothetical protein
MSILSEPGLSGPRAKNPGGIIEVPEGGAVIVQPEDHAPSRSLKRQLSAENEDAPPTPQTKYGEVPATPILNPSR